MDLFPGLARLDVDVRDTLIARARLARHKAGAVLFGPGTEPQSLLLLTKGTIKVQKVSEQGREIVLYRVSAGESCILTSACLLAYQGQSAEDQTAEGVAETDIEAVAIPRAVFEDLISRSGGFRQFVFAAYAKRLTDLFMVIDDVAFQRVDLRLAQKLLDLANEDGLIATTHQQLAKELGSAREVVSRQLQEFQRRGWVRGSRGQITLLERLAIERFARGLHQPT
jgi:CRP/FNR family transcriptional regulator